MIMVQSMMTWLLSCMQPLCTPLSPLILSNELTPVMQGLDTACPCSVPFHPASMEYLDSECGVGLVGMDQVCEETVIKEKVDMALLKMMMDLGYENIQPHHLVNMDLPYFVHLLLGAVICAAGTLSTDRQRYYLAHNK